MSKSSSTVIKVTRATSRKKPTTAKTRVKRAIKTKPKASASSIKATKKSKVAVKVKAQTKTKVKTNTKSSTKKSAETKVEEQTNEIPRNPRAPILSAKQSIVKRNPLGHLLIEKMLREEGFKGGVTTDKEILNKYSTDESIFTVRPQIVIQPKNRRDVEVVTKIIARETKRFDSLSLTPRANGTAFDGSSLSDSVVIDISAHLTKIGEISKKDDGFVFSAEAGVSWRELEAKLKSHKAYIPKCTALHDISTLGGAVSSNTRGPDSDKYGLCSDWILSLDMVLTDGHQYTINPLTYKEFKALTKKKHEYARILRSVFALIKKYEADIIKVAPEVDVTEDKIEAGNSLAKVLPQGVEAFTKGKGHFDLTKFVAGSQGALGIITNIKMRALPIEQNVTVLTVPIFQLEDMSTVVEKINQYQPINFEILDSRTFDNALKSPNFFKKRLEGLPYYRAMLSLYTSYHVRFGKRTPEFILVATLDKDTVDEHSGYEIVTTVNTTKTRSRIVTTKAEAEMLRQLNSVYYTLAKIDTSNSRPASFLHPVSIPPANLFKFMNDAKNMFKELSVPVTIHGQGKSMTFSFLPHLDFTQKTTSLLVERLANNFYHLVDKHQGLVVGGQTGSLPPKPATAPNSTTSATIQDLNSKVENIFDPDDIFNPGRKTAPRFDIKGMLRTTN